MKRFLPLIVILLFLSASCLAADYSEWKWSSELPLILFSVPAPDTVRNLEGISTAIKKLRRPIKVEELIKLIGVPDQFSPQTIYSYRKGGEPFLNNMEGSSGTYRYLLSDESEVHVGFVPGGFVSGAIHYDKAGSGTLLYK